MSLLNTPFVGKNLQLQTRLVMPPMATSKADERGLVTQELVDYYDQRARSGGLGLIITEHAFISPEGRASRGQLSLAEDAVIPGLSHLTQVIHESSCKVFAQISHAGAFAKPQITGHPALGPSRTSLDPGKSSEELPVEMGIHGIKRLTRSFAKAAVRAKESGFDGVEIHSAHGYLLNQFLSPLSNQRTDEYGGCLENRIRFHLEVLEAVREAVGDDYPIAIRLGACDYMEGGTTLSDAVWVAKQLEEKGLDLIDISGGFCGYKNPYSEEQGWFSSLSQAVKEQVEIPVLLTGGITDPKIAESLLERKKADLIGVGRAILKDPLWPAKAMEALK